jgi:hypothetical protein
MQSTFKLLVVFDVMHFNSVFDTLTEKKEPEDFS